MKSRITASFLLIFILISLLIVAGNKTNKYHDFVSNIEMELRNVNTGMVSIKIPEDIMGTLILSTPYAIDRNETDLMKLFNSNLVKDLSDYSYSDSGFYVMIVNENKIVFKKTWERPPIVFNGYMVKEIQKSNVTINFDLADKFLQNITVH